MFRFYIPSILFASGTSLVKFLLAIPQDQFLHGGIICWGYIQNSIVVLNERDLTFNISPTIYFPERLKIRHLIEDPCKKLTYLFRFYIPSILFAAGTSLVKFLLAIPQDQFLYGGIICWGYIQNSIVVFNERDLTSNISPTIYFPERMKIRHLIEDPCKKLTYLFRFYIPSILFAAGTSLVKFLLAIPQDQFLHGGIICWGYIQNSIVVLNERDLTFNISPTIYFPAWWRHQMETFSALLAICAENSPVPGEFPAQRPVTRSFDVFFDLHPNKRLSKQSWGWWSETPSSSLWRHRNGTNENKTSNRESL